MNRNENVRASGPAVCLPVCYHAYQELILIAQGQSIMPQSHAQVRLHIVFSTKGRRPFLRKDSFRSELVRMLSHHVKAQNCLSASVRGHFDHVHLLPGLSRTIAKLVENVKIETSKWAKHHQDGSSIFAWQSGSGAFSVSQSLMAAVDTYIRHQLIAGPLALSFH